MSQKENKTSRKNFTGFIAYYNDGKLVREKENFYSDILNKKCATNWLEINKDKLQALELVWKGVSKIKLDKTEFPHITPTDWFFSHSGIQDMSSRNINIISRNIGYKKDNILNIFSIKEENGDLKITTRVA